MKKKAKLVSRATGLGLLCIMFFSCKEKTSNQIQNEIQNQTSISSPQKGMQEHIPNYADGNGTILSSFSKDGVSTIIRKCEMNVTIGQMLSEDGHTMYKREKPGLNDNVVVYTIRPGDSDPTQTNVQTLAITEESDTIDGITDRWVKISYKEHEGWIFGGYTSAERGGPRYYIPENWIAFDLGDLP